MNKIILVANYSIPKKKAFTLPHPRDSDLIKELQYNYTRLCEKEGGRGWSLLLRHHLATLLGWLQEESL